MVGDQLWFVGLDELGQILHRGLEFVQPPRSDFGGVDVDDGLGHVCSDRRVR
jgi:hypothetical protein